MGGGPRGERIEDAAPAHGAEAGTSAGTANCCFRAESDGFELAGPKERSSTHRGFWYSAAAVVSAMASVFTSALYSYATSGKDFPLTFYIASFILMMMGAAFFLRK